MSKRRPAAPFVLRNREHAAPMHREPRPGEVMTLKQPGYPHLRFEWHPRAQPNPDTPKGVCFCIEIGVLNEQGAEMAEPFAWGIRNSGQAHNAVLIFLRGYKKRDLEIRTGSVAERRERSDYVKLG